ncbi:uncharacterized protein DNG_03213 [Cephalotrichum gorgonifer]|uniref:AAA+ ATPase domain-containing protein n=1 Tax=Cephalotrichum gorgonifer TaxID=2041049 RepID=A0AAE8MUT2_9PEZI|nr:uncharacterized protein DNG_03213 [Cephalotrichum gorgonifer]
MDSFDADQAEGSFAMIDPVHREAQRPDDVSGLSCIVEKSTLVQNLYEGPRKCQCCINWVDHLPDNADIEEENDEDGFPLVVRYSISRGEDTSRISIHSIDIRDSATREALFSVFDGFDNINPSINYLIFEAPFMPFFYRWEQFEKAIESCTAPHTKEVLAQLHAIVKTELAEAFAISAELIKNGVISYPYLWTVFRPGEILCQDAPVGGPRLYYLESTVIHAKLPAEFQLLVQFVDYGAGYFGLGSTDFSIWPFRGTKKITDLPVYPLRFRPDLAAVKQTAISRGRQFHALAGVHYKEYLDDNVKEGESRKQYRRIIVDSQGNKRRRGLLSPLAREGAMNCDTGVITQVPPDAPPVNGHKSLKTNRWRDGSRESDLERDEVSPDGRRRPGQTRRRRRERSVSPVEYRRARHPRSVSPVYRPYNDYNGGREDLDEFHLQLCTNVVRGFCLKDKTWETFFVDRIRNIEWNPDPFKTLVLPDGYRDLVLSFVESHIGSDQTFADVINGKGSGLVVLLSGPPGVGKTLTAESVSETLRVPLFMLDLAQAVEELEGDVHRMPIRDRHVRPQLDIADAFDLASRWKAILLIDECDLYLEPRSEATPVRNRIVTRFLHEVEYSSSLLFLTTNRPNALDPAIASRIHLTVNYPDLNWSARRAIWENFLEHHGGPRLSSDKLQKLAEVELNGRKIRNVVKAAAIMAKRNKRGVELGDIQTVLRITEGYSVKEE